MKRHWEARTYYKGKLVSTTLNCLDAPDKASAQAIAEAEYKADADRPKYDRVTVRLKGCKDDLSCLPWDVEQ